MTTSTTQKTMTAFALTGLAERSFANMIVNGTPATMLPATTPASAILSLLSLTGSAGRLRLASRATGVKRVQIDPPLVQRRRALGPGA